MFSLRTQQNRANVVSCVFFNAAPLQQASVAVLIIIIIVVVCLLVDVVGTWNSGVRIFVFYFFFFCSGATQQTQGVY